MVNSLKCRKIDCDLRIRPLTGWDDECGDNGVIIINENYCFFGLVDVLGHGEKAYRTAIQAKEYLTGHSEDDLVEILIGLHDLLLENRGAVAAICRLNMKTGELCSAGIGNISTRIFGDSQRRIMFKNGIIGNTQAPIHVEEDKITLSSGDILIMSSDGLKEHYDIYDYPGILVGSAGDIADQMIEKLGKHDDVSCLVLRYDI